MSNLPLWQLVEVTKLKYFFKQMNVDCVFDVGANRGQYKDLLRDHVKFQGPIISFEPVPHAFNEMKKRADQDPSWYLRPVALDRFPGEAKFNIMKNDKFSSLKAPNSEEYAKLDYANNVVSEVTVEKSTLAIELARFARTLGFERPFLKMDTQGNDIAVVEGAGTDILRFIGLQSELSIKKLYKDTLYFHEVISYYNAKGFGLTALIDNTAGHFPDLVEMDCIMYRLGG